jgi:hypothetical protein
MIVLHYVMLSYVPKLQAPSGQSSLFVLLSLHIQVLDSGFVSKSQCVWRPFKSELFGASVTTLWVGLRYPKINSGARVEPPRMGYNDYSQT